MHDQMLTLMDDCVTRLMLLRADLAACRRVEPGERLATVQRAIATAEQFVEAAGQAIGEPACETLLTRSPAS